MRTTITLTPEAELLVHRAMEERRMSFKDVVNGAIISGLTSRRDDIEHYRLPVFAMGTLVAMDDVTAVLNRLDDEEFLRKQELGK